MIGLTALPDRAGLQIVKMVMKVTEQAMADSKQFSAPETGSWTVAEAKARLSEVIARAQTDPQIITRRGKPCVVVVSAEEWARKTVRKGTLAEFLMASPLRGADLDLERVREPPRDVDL